MGGIKNQIMTLFKTKDYSQPKRVKLSQGWKEPTQTQNVKQFEDNN